MRDENALESAAARPKQLAHDREERSIALLGAALAWSLLRNHAFFERQQTHCFRSPGVVRRAKRLSPCLLRGGRDRYRTAHDSRQSHRGAMDRMGGAGRRAEAAGPGRGRRVIPNECLSEIQARFQALSPTRARASPKRVTAGAPAQAEASVWRFVGSRPDCVDLICMRFVGISRGRAEVACFVCKMKHAARDPLDNRLIGEKGLRSRASPWSDG